MISTLVTRTTLTILLTLSGSLAIAQDRVFVKQGTPAQGTITELTPVKVVIEVRGKPQTYQLKEVRKITFDKEPVSLDRARDFAIEGKYTQAIEELRTVKQDSLEGRSKEDYEFYLAYCAGAQSLAGSGDPNAAIRGLIAVDKAAANGHHRFEVQEMLGRLALSMAHHDKAKSAAYFDKAKSFFEALEQSPEATQKSLGIYYQGSVLHAQSKAPEAKALLKKLLDAQASSPEMARVKNLATILDARCDNETGQSQQALETLNAMAEREDNTDLQLFAKINNARGDCYQTMNQPQRAAYSYLQTDLLFFTDPETHAEALFHLKKLLVTIGEPAKAALAGERLSKQYASSLWANKK